jgi:hypothetical protein
MANTNNTSLEAQNKLRKELSQLNITDLEERLQKTLDQQHELQFDVDDDLKAKLLAVLNAEGLWVVDYRFATSLHLVKRQLEKEEVKLNTDHISVLYKLFVEKTTIGSLKEAAIVDDALQAMNPINVKMHELDIQIRHTSEILKDKKKEDKTGLKIKDGDQENALKVQEQIRKEKEEIGAKINTSNSKKTGQKKASMKKA